MSKDQSKKRRKRRNDAAIYSIYEAAAAIEAGRKGFATRGKEHEGRLSYERGINAAMAAFKEAQTTADPHDAKYRVKGFPMDSYHIASIFALLFCLFLC